MSTHRLPDRPSLENLKKQAKSLLHAVHAQDPAALQRFAVLPGFAGTPAAELAGRGLALHDAQSVIARELGFASWNALREEVEARTLSFDAAVDEFVRCATGGVPGRAERLLALHPGIASASLQAALVLGDAASVDVRLRDVAVWIAAHGGMDELSPVERFIAACARGDRESATAMLAARPGLRTELRPEHQLMLHRPAESGNAAVLETMLACGFNPTSADKDGVTALHRAAMNGHVDAVHVLLRFGADVNALDGMFAAPPLVWAVEGRSHAGAGADHVAVARALIAAGSPLEWTPPDGAPSPERTLEGLIDLRRDAAAGA